MIFPDSQVLEALVDRYSTGTRLTSTECREITHIAQGFASKGSATADGCAVETIRSRRKKLYRKLHLSGANQLISSLLALSLDMLARGERPEETRRPLANDGTAGVPADGRNDES